MVLIDQIQEWLICYAEFHVRVNVIKGLILAKWQLD